MTDKQLLELIEGMSVLWGSGDINNKSRTDTIIGTIYKCSHIGINRCGTLHEDWREEAQKLYDSLKSGEII